MCFCTNKLVIFIFKNTLFLFFHNDVRKSWHHKEEHLHAKRSCIQARSWCIRQSRTCNACRLENVLWETWNALGMKNLRNRKRVSNNKWLTSKEGSSWKQTSWSVNFWQHPSWRKFQNNFTDEKWKTWKTGNHWNWSNFRIFLESSNLFYLRNE